MPPRTVAVKGLMLRKTDQKLSAMTLAERQALVEKIRTSTSAADLAVEVGTVDPTGGGKGHVNEEFLGNDEKGWFQSASMKREILQAAYMKAIEESVRTEDPADPNVDQVIPKPIVSFWINGASKFEAVVARTDSEVLVILLTPTPSGKAAHPAAVNVYQDNLWLVAPQARIQEVRDEQPAEYQELLEPAQDLVTGVQSQRLVGY